MNIIREEFPEESWPPLEQETLEPVPINDLPGLQTSTQNKIYVWNPCPDVHMNTHRLYYCLRSRIQRIQDLIDATQDHDVSFALRMWQDAHIPLAYYYQTRSSAPPRDDQMHEVLDSYAPNIDRVFHEGNLPNLLSYIPFCNYWRQTKKKKNFTFIEALIWLISKAIPWRCNVRAIRNTFTQDCLPEHPNIYEIIVKFFTCSMLGAYRHAKVSPRFATRVQIYGLMIFMPVDRNRVIWWFQIPENQSVLQNIIREFIVFATSNIPALRQAMVERHRWDLVEDSCYKAMDQFRACIDKNSADGSMKWFQNIKDVLTDFDTYHLKLNIFTHNSRLFIEKMAEECINFDDEMYGNPQYRQQVFTDTEINCLRDVLLRCKKDRIPFYLLVATEEIPVPYKTQSGETIIVNFNRNPFETDPNKINKLVELMYAFYQDHDTKPLGEYLKTLTVYEYQKISNFFYLLKEQQSIRIRLLPMHYYEYQLQALCKKYQVRTAAEIPPSAGWFYYSQCCGFKGFIVPPEGSKQRTSNLQACGSDEAMYSFEDGEVYCFHKVNKNKRRKQNPRNRTSIEMFSEIQEVNHKRLSKDQRRQKLHATCSKIPLKQVSLIGFAIECQAGLLMLCCKCANPATVGINKYEGDKFICTRCNDKKNLYKEIQCYNCQNIQEEGKDPFASIEVYDDIRKNPPAFSNIYLCKKCNRKWISEGTSIFSLSIIEKGLEEKWRTFKQGDQCFAMPDQPQKKKRIRVSKNIRLGSRKLTKDDKISSFTEIPTNLPEPESKRPVKRRKKE